MAKAPADAAAGSLRETIVAEIRRLASENGGVPPGYKSFAKATGISQGKWLGRVFPNWGAALSEAGFEPNELNRRLDSSEIIRKIAEFCIELGRVPTGPELRLRRTNDAEFPNHSTIWNHFPTKADLVSALRTLASTDGYGRLLAILPDALSSAPVPKRAAQEGLVYLMKSGAYYKIGRSDDVERRVREIKVGQPEKLSLEHSIRTDDPSGIEAYWHRRFADRRANGEWFRLTADDVRAFCRRKFQ